MVPTASRAQWTESQISSCAVGDEVPRRRLLSLSPRSSRGGDICRGTSDSLFLSVVAPRGGGGAVPHRRWVIECLWGHRIETHVGVRCSPCYVCTVPAGALLCFLLCLSSLGCRDSGQTLMRVGRISQRHDTAWAPRISVSRPEGVDCVDAVRRSDPSAPRGADSIPSEPHHPGTAGFTATICVLSWAAKAVSMSAALAHDTAAVVADGVADPRSCCLIDVAGRWVTS